MKKYAFLITAHTDVEQLLRLMRRLLSLGDIYLLLDKKVKDQDYLSQVETFINHSGGAISLVEPRVNITWGGFSQCKGQEALLDAFANSGKAYERMFFLSGLDYVLVSDDEFRDFFEKNQEREFVCGYNVSKSGDGKQQWKVKYYHLFRNMPLGQRNFLRRCIIAGTRLALRMLGLRKPVSIPMGDDSWDVYYGSQWTSMTSGCARYVLGQMKNNRKVRRYFSTSFAPDELYIPTLVFNSEYGRHAIPSAVKGLKQNTPLHYLNYRGHIYTYDESDYDTLMSSGKIFVRKLVSGKSERLMEMIDECKNSE